MNRAAFPIIVALLAHGTMAVAGQSIHALVKATAGKADPAAAARVRQQRIALGGEWVAAAQRILAEPPSALARLIDGALAIAPIPLGRADGAILQVATPRREIVLHDAHGAFNAPLAQRRERLASFGALIDQTKPEDAVRAGAEQVLLEALAKVNHGKRAEGSKAIARALRMQERGQLPGGRTGAFAAALAPLAVTQANVFYEQLDMDRAPGGIAVLRHAAADHPRVGVDWIGDHLSFVVGEDRFAVDRPNLVRAIAADQRLDLGAIVTSLNDAYLAQAQKVVRREDVALETIDAYGGAIDSGQRQAHAARKALVSKRRGTKRSLWAVTRDTMELARQVFDRDRLYGLKEDASRAAERKAKQFLDEAAAVLGNDEDPLFAQLQSAVAVSPVVSVFVADQGRLSIKEVDGEARLWNEPADPRRYTGPPSSWDVAEYPQVVGISAQQAIESGARRALLAAAKDAGVRGKDDEAIRQLMTLQDEGAIPRGRARAFQRAIGPWFEPGGLASQLLDAQIGAASVEVMTVKGDSLRLARRRDGAVGFEIDGKSLSLAQLARAYEHESLQLRDLVQGIGDAMDRANANVSEGLQQLVQQARRLD